MSKHLNKMCLLDIQRFADDGGAGGTGDSSGYTIGIDTDKLNNGESSIISRLTNITAKVDASIIHLYELIDNGFSGKWEGSAYEQFRTTCDNYRPAMEQLVEFMEGFCVLLSNVNEDGVILLDAVKKCVESVN